MPKQLDSVGFVARRLHTQRLAGWQFNTPADAVSFFGAVQAQDYPASLWGLGQRVAGATVDVIEKAVADGAILRTWPFRGTIHFVTPADVRWMLALSASRALKMNARHRELGLDEATFAQARKVIESALRDGRPRPRPALRQALDDAGISTEGQRGIHILGRLAQEGLICIGPRQGKQQTFVLIEAWLPAGRKLARDEALAELTRRYFTSHGPATPADFAWWSGLSKTEAQAGLQMVKPQLAQESIGEQVYWFAPSQSAGEMPSPTAHLLPVYDEYVVAYKDRTAVLVPEYAAREDAGNGIFRPPILIDGQIVGTWTRELKKDKVVVSPNLFRRLAPDEETALLAAAERYGAFLGLAVELEGLG
jgi:hypothetical protein